MNLTTSNGYPQHTINRNSGTPDFDEVVLRYQTLGRGLATEYGLSSDFDTYYAIYLGNGKHPQAAFDEALRVLGIANEGEFIYYTDEDHG